jgi:hypothetical protein
MLNGIRHLVREGLGKTTAIGTKLGTMIGIIEGTANFIDPEPKSDGYIPGGLSLYRKFGEVQHRKEMLRNQSIEQVLDQDAPQSSVAHDYVMDSSLNTRLTAALSAFSLNTACGAAVGTAVGVIMKPAGAAILTLAGGVGFVFNSDSDVPSDKSSSGYKPR